MAIENSNTDESALPATTTDDGLAADLVLGVLSESEREAAEQRVLVDPVFATLVGAWQKRLAILPDPIEPVTPPDSLWAKIAAATQSDR